MSDLIELTKEIYSETNALLRDRELAAVVEQGPTILYGPPIPKPGLLLLSFQGGGADGCYQSTWPQKLLYLDDQDKPGNQYKFGRNLCNFCRDAELFTSLEHSAMALSAVFPQAPGSGDWARATGPTKAHEKWRQHSKRCVERLTDAIRPKVVMIFGENTSRTLGVKWENEEHNHGQKWRTFGTSRYRGVEAVYCCHLSRPVNKEALKCFKYAKEVIDRG